MGRDAKTSAAGLFTPPAGGGLVAVAAPAGAVDARDFEAGLDALGRLVPECGIKVEQGVFDRQGYLAGPDQSRARALAGLFADARVQTIISARGGFGSSRLLPLLDLGAMAASKTLFMGFSDISCLLCCLAGRGLVTVHGPVVTQIPRLDGPSLADLKNLLNGRPPWPMTLEGSPVAPGKPGAGSWAAT